MLVIAALFSAHHSCTCHVCTVRFSEDVESTSADVCVYVCFFIAHVQGTYDGVDDVFVVPWYVGIRKPPQNGQHTLSTIIYRRSNKFEHNS